MDGGIKSSDESNCPLYLYCLFKSCAYHCRTVWRITIMKKSRHNVFKLLNQFYSGEGEKILLKEKKKIRKLLSEAALEHISSLNDPSFPSNSHFYITLKLIS